MAAEFLKLVPGDLPPEQVEEIEGLLARFQIKVRRHEIPVEDEVEIKRLMSQYIDRGSITKKELNTVMARVGYYSVRGSTPDSIGIHPLVED